MQLVDRRTNKPKRKYTTGYFKTFFFLKKGHHLGRYKISITKSELDVILLNLIQRLDLRKKLTISWEFLRIIIMIMNAREQYRRVKIEKTNRPDVCRLINILYLFKCLQFWFFFVYVYFKILLTHFWLIIIICKN